MPRRQAVYQQGTSFVYVDAINLVPSYAEGQDLLVRFNKENCVKHLFQCQTKVCDDKVQIKIDPTQCIEGEDDYLLEILALDKKKLTEVDVNVLRKKIYH